jgi:hypothetical protein
MFYGQRVVDIKDGLPKWTGMSGKSDLIEDSPLQEVRKRKREIEEEEEDEEEEEREEGKGNSGEKDNENKGKNSGREKESRKTYNLR